MDIHDLRRTNLSILLTTRFNGSQAAMAAAIDRQASYISRCLAPPGKNSKPIGEKFARHIEQALDLLPGALDAAPGVDSAERRDLLPAGGNIADPLLYPVEVWDD